MRSAFLCLIFLAALSGATHAQIVQQRIPPYQCQRQNLYGSQDAPAAPALVAAALAQSGGALEFRTCRDNQSNIHYFLREKRPNRGGVCRMYEHEIFPGSPSDTAWFATQYDQHSPQTLPGWSEAPPPAWQADNYVPKNAEFALVTGEPCPSSLDAHYATVHHVTDGMLKAFDTAWRTAIASPAAFDQAFATAALRDRATPALKAQFRDDAVAGKIHFGDIRCGGDGCAAFTSDVIVSFDLAGGGLVFTALSPVYVI